MKPGWSKAFAVGVVVATVLGVIDGQRNAVPFLGILQAARFTGYAAFGCLLLSLSMRPLADLAGLSTRARNLLRRRFGVLAAALACSHFLWVWRTLYPDRLSEAVSDSVWLQLGSGALLTLVLLWLTSYPPLVRAARVKNWKALHSLSLAAAALASMHLLLAPWSSARLSLVFCGYFLLLAGWRVARWGREKASATESPVPRKPD